MEQNNTMSETLDQQSTKTKPLSTFDGKQTEIEQIKTNEENEKSNEHFKDLKSSAAKVQKEIEESGGINDEARKERGDITVEQVGSDFKIGSYMQKTLIKFVDDYTVSIVGGKGHDLTVGIDPIEGMDQIIKVTNIVNMVMKKSAGQEKVYNGTSMGGGGPQNINKIWIDVGFGGTNLVSHSMLEKLSVDPGKFTTYINERKYAEK